MTQANPGWSGGGIESDSGAEAMAYIPNPGAAAAYHRDLTVNSSLQLRHDRRFQPDRILRVTLNTDRVWWERRR
jgi:hypothetical protein